MPLKHNDCIRSVLFELGSNRSRAQVKYFSKLNRRHGNDEFWKKLFHVCSVVCKRPFHGKTHWDRVELNHILTWITFWPWPGKSPTICLQTCGNPKLKLGWGLNPRYSGSMGKIQRVHICEFCWIFRGFSLREVSARPNRCVALRCLKNQPRRHW